MTHNNIQFLLIGTLFVIIGLCTLIFRKEKKLAGLTPLIIGLIAIFLTTVGPLSKSQDKVNELIKLDRNDVKDIVIKPTEYKGYEQISLIKEIVQITDKSKIDSLCFALTNAKTTTSIIKNPTWVCFVRLNKTNNSFIEFEVKNAEQITLVEVNSNGDYGWDYGTLDAGHFGQLLVDITK